MTLTLPYTPSFLLETFLAVFKMKTAQKDPAMDIRKDVEDNVTTLFAFPGDGTATVLWTNGTTYAKGDTILANPNTMAPNGLDGMKVSLLDGRVYILDFVNGTPNRPAHYRTRCHTHRLNLDGSSQCRAKYNIDHILDAA